MLEVVCGRALAAPASRRSAAASTADGSEARKPAASRGPGACTVLYRYRRISGYPTIRDIRRLFHGIWIYLDHPHQLSVSTRWQNGHYPVNPDCAGANRIHALMGSSSVSSFARLIRGMVVGWVSARPLARCRSAETGLRTGWRWRAVPVAGWARTRGTRTASGSG